MSTDTAPVNGWFSDPGATRTIPLGPGASFSIRYPLSRADVAAAVAIDGLTDDAEIAAAIMRFVPEWNLPDHTGESRPPTPENFVALSVAGQSAIISALAAAVKDSVTVPNGSAVPSRPSSRGNGSRSRTKTPTPTT